MVFRKPTVANSRFSWSSSSEKSSMEFDYSEQDMPQTRHQMPKEMGEGWFQSFHLPLNMVIRRGIVHFKPEVFGTLLPVATIEEKFWEPVLCVHSARKGRVVLFGQGLGEGFIFGQNNCLFEHIDVRDSIVKLDASENLEMTTLLIGDSVLRELLGKEYAQALLVALRVEAISEISVNNVPQHINNLLHSSIPDHLTGNIAKLHIQAKILDYLCALAQYFVGATDNPQPESEIHAKIIEMHDDLLKLEGKVPSLNELAKQYDLTVRILKEGFTKMYGKSVFSYISEVRLNEAHATLLKSDMAMKIIAKNLGYSHVNHFISAFGKQFGYSPGSLRKKK